MLLMLDQLQAAMQTFLSSRESRIDSLLIIPSEMLFLEGHVLCLSLSMIIVPSVDVWWLKSSILMEGLLSPLAYTGGGAAGRTPRRSYTQGQCTAHRHCFCTKFPETGHRGLWGAYISFLLECHQDGLPVNQGIWGYRFSFMCF